MQNLPDEIFIEVFTHFNPKELSPFFLVSTTFYEQCSNDVLWREFVRKYLTKEKVKDLSYKEFYKEAYKEFGDAITNHQELHGGIVFQLLGWHRTYEILFIKALGCGMSVNEICYLAENAIIYKRIIYFDCLLPLVHKQKLHIMFYAAFQCGDENIIHTLLDYCGPKAKAIYSKTRPRLTTLIQTGNKNALLAVIKNIEMAEREFLKRRLIHSAIISESMEMVNYFIETFGNEILEVRDKFGNTILHTLCKSKNMEFIKEIVPMKKDLLEAENVNSLLPIHVACKHSSPEVVEYILQISKDSKVSVIHWKLIAIAMKRDSLDMLKLLLSKERGKQIVYSNSKKALLNVFENCQRHEKFMEILKYSNLDYCLKKKMVSPLHLAAALGHKEAIEYIIEKSPNLVNFCSKLYSDRICSLILSTNNIRGMFYPIDFALLEANVQAFKILLQKGAKITIRQLENAYQYNNFNKEIFFLLMEELQRQNLVNESLKRKLFSYAIENDRTMRMELEEHENEEFLAQLCYEEILKVNSCTSNAEGYKGKLLDILSQEERRDIILEHFYIQEYNWFQFLHSVVKKIGPEELLNHFKEFIEKREVDSDYSYDSYDSYFSSYSSDFDDIIS